ncbi:MAG: hypothetical protein IPG77_01145 [Betaproteobacteria bacterium]|nr:hypothetical protein [Betaproteobacteria bacterium]
MNFPGLCKLTLTEQAICQAIEGTLNAARKIEGTLNAARKDGEDYVRVTEIKREGYGYGDFVLTITTDVPQADVVTLADNAQEAA